MADYTPIADFASKDSLAATDGNRLIKGKELDNEFTAIETAISTKLDDTFVLPEVEAVVPAFSAINYTDTNVFTTFAQTYRLTDTVSFTPDTNTSSALVRFNVNIRMGEQEPERASEGIIIKCIVRNNDTNVETDYGRLITITQRFTLEDQTFEPNTVTVGFISQRIYNLVFADSRPLAAVAGGSSTGYTFIFEGTTISANNAVDTFGSVEIRQGGTISVQEVVNG